MLILCKQENIRMTAKIKMCFFNDTTLSIVSECCDKIMIKRWFMIKILNNRCKTIKINKIDLLTQEIKKD